MAVIVMKPPPATATPVGRGFIDVVEDACCGVGSADEKARPATRRDLVMGIAVVGCGVMVCFLFRIVVGGDTRCFFLWFLFGTVRK